MVSVHAPFSKNTYFHEDILRKVSKRRFIFASIFQQFPSLFRHRFSHRFVHRIFMENGSQNCQKSISHFGDIFVTFSKGRLFHAFWSPFRSLWAPLWLPLAPFDSLFAPFGSLFAPFCSILAPFWCPWAPFCSPWHSIFSQNLSPIWDAAGWWRGGGQIARHFWNPPNRNKPNT